MPAQQRRSRETEAKLVQASYECLRHCDFEQLRIADIAAEAEVAVGTFYRRFADKQALLELLYAHFHSQLEGFIAELELLPERSLAQRLQTLSSGLASFFRFQRPVLRALYLHSLKQPQMMLLKPAQQERFQHLLLGYCQDIEQAQRKVSLALSILWSQLLSAACFSDSATTQLHSLSLDRLADECPKLLQTYLTH